MILLGGDVDAPVREKYQQWMKMEQFNILINNLGNLRKNH